MKEADTLSTLPEHAPTKDVYMRSAKKEFIKINGLKKPVPITYKVNT